MENISAHLPGLIWADKSFISRVKGMRRPANIFINAAWPPVMRAVWLPAVRIYFLLMVMLIIIDGRMSRTLIKRIKRVLICGAFGNMPTLLKKI